MAHDVVSALIPFIHWTRTYNETFHLDIMLEELDVEPTKDNIAFLKRVIEYNHIAYTSNFDFTGEWYARNLICLDSYFAFTPTQLEAEKRVIVQGSRFDPYISNLANAMTLKIKYRNRLIEPSLLSLPFSQIREYYYLYSKDELMEHLNSITANNHHFSHETNDDTHFYIPCFDMEKCYDDSSFGKDTKLIFQVEEFEHKIVRFVEKIDEKLSQKYIADWEKEFKKFFFVAASINQIDCTTISDLIANTFFMGMESTLCKHFLISPQEYLQKHNLLQDVRTGVKESRWIKDVPIYPYNFWFHYVLNFRYLVFRANADEHFFASIYSPITEAIIYFFILDFAENNYLAVSQDDGECKDNCIKTFLNDFFNLESHKQYHKKIASIIKRKYKKYSKHYNPFNKSAEIDVAIAILKVLKRVVFAVSHLQQLEIGPKDIPSDISIVVQQMSQDIDYAAKNIMHLMKNKNIPDRDKSIAALSDLTEKFEVIADEMEQFVFSRYGRP